MINQIKVANFKCFQKTKTFEFSNLNLLTGINGRGKSSILQSMLLISQSVDNYRESDTLKLNGKHIKLGNYDDVKNSDTVRSEDIEFQFVFEDKMFANFKFNENEKDQLTAKVVSSEVKITGVKEVDSIQTMIGNFVTKITDEYKQDTNDPALQIDISRIAFNHFISKIHYISADRLGPVKYVDKASLPDPNFITVGPRGEYSINILAKDDLPLVNDKLYLGKDAKSVIQQTEEWLGYILEGAKIDINGRDSSSSVLWMSLNNKSNSYKYKPANVGFGYSYILPLIVGGLIATSEDIIIVENPEAHLHPRAQSRIAEFFTRVASCGTQVFIESHSEHILNGLRVSTLNPEISLTNKDFTIHYFNESFESEKLVMNEQGKIPNWPSGFFDQQEIDLANIFKLTI